MSTETTTPPPPGPSNKSETKTMSKTATRSPVLFTAVGRQRTGKTALLNAITEITIRQGGQPEIWNTDLLNQTHSITRYHPQVQQPDGTTVDEQRKWLESRIHAMIKSRRDVILDIGGGWTAFHEILNNTPLMPALAKAGIKVVVVYMIGPELADADYLTDLSRNRNFLPGNSLIVFNEGLIPAGTSPRGAFDKVLAHDAVVDAVSDGALLRHFPSLESMSEVTDRSISFSDFCDGSNPPGFDEIGFFDQLRVEEWFFNHVVSFLGSIDPALLPDMPEGLPAPREYQAA